MTNDSLVTNPTRLPFFPAMPLPFTIYRAKAFNLARNHFHSHSLFSFLEKNRKNRKEKKPSKKKEIMDRWRKTRNPRNWNCKMFLPVVVALIVYFWKPLIRESFRFRPLRDSRHSAEVFHSPEVFKKDYMDMERNFNIFVYPYTDKDDVISSEAYEKPKRLGGTYGSEVHFFENLQQSPFLTDDPDKAHLFFIPISCYKLRREGRSYVDIAIAFQDYVESLITKYPYWNRTLGADHFSVTCHDIGVTVTEPIPHLTKNLIQVVCSPSYNVQYVPHKDVTLPQIIQPFALPPGGNNLKKRTVLAFWAGRRSSTIRDKLIQSWQNDTELDIQNEGIGLLNVKGRIIYQEKFLRSKFCICPGALHVHGARIAEAIHYGCVPVILSDYSVLPFNNILDWRKFSVIVMEKDVHQLKNILKSITDEKYRILQTNTVKIQKHFQWNSPSVELDAFRMVMYELWLRRHVVKYEQVEGGTHTTSTSHKKEQ